MKPDEFAALANALRVRPVIPPGGQRHVYLWCNNLSTLNTILDRATVLILDLHELTRSLERKPNNANAARQVLEDAISGWLHGHQTQESQHQIIVVTGCDLLMRYSVSLGEFMQYAADNRMVVLVVPPYRTPSAPLPEYVDFKVTGILNYLKHFVADSCIVE